MNKYIPLHCHSHYSLLDGIAKPDQIAQRIKDLDLDGCAITDHGSLAGSIEFFKQMGKKDLQPILGCELYVCGQDSSIKNEENRSLSHMLVLAKGNGGWKRLIQLTSESNLPENFYYKPRLSLLQLAKFSHGDLIFLSGHLGSTLCNVVLEKGYEEVKENWLEDGIKWVNWFKEIFGKDNFFIEIQLVDKNVNPIVIKLATCLRRIAEQTQTLCVATPDSHYCKQEDQQDQWIVLCRNLNMTIKEARNSKMNGFFKSNNYYIPSYNEMIEYGNTKEELANTLKVAEMCGKYELLKKSQLPNFECPDKYTPDEWLKELCRKGWREKIKDKIDEKQHEIYKQRVLEELGVLQGANLSSYFLIVKNIIDYAKSIGCLIGLGRGSAAGCLVSYLVGITGVDPVKYDLLFARFYSEGREGSLPDIDIDVPAHKRDEIIDYIKEKYGKNKVGQMITFQTMKGRAALKDSMRAFNTPFNEMNEITKYIPDEAKIADDLQEMKEEFGESSIIRWALENDDQDKLKEWCSIDENGNLIGDKSTRFAQAICLEGTNVAQSKHPAGVVISLENLSDVCPMVLDTKNKQLVAGLEMESLEDIGLVKFDILGLNLLDKLMDISHLLEYGDEE